MAGYRRQDFVPANAEPAFDPAVGQALPISLVLILIIFGVIGF